jgi:GNAT superfamily N-acetyltransferase
VIEVHAPQRQHLPQLAALLRSEEFGLHTAAFQVEQRRSSFPWWVAVRDGAVVGFLEGHFHSLFDERLGYGDVPGAWIYWVGVHPEHRRAGVARALVGAFAEEASARGDGHMACMLDQRTPTQGRLAFFPSIGMDPVFPDEPDDVVAGLTERVIRLSR